MGLKGRTRVAIKDAVQGCRNYALPWLRRIRPSQYTDADPFKVIHVPPDHIRAMQLRWSGPIELPWLDAGLWKKHSSLLRRWHAGLVLAGDWDLATQNFADYHLSAVFQERFQEGKDWQEIAYVQSALRKVNRGQPAWGNRCHTPADVWARCQYLDKLYRRIQSQGYCFDSSQAANFSLPYTHFLVNIGRNGDIIRNNDGKHRILMSRLIGIPYLSARVFVRHRQWQAIRDAVRADRGSDWIEQFQHHPDLQDILPGTQNEKVA
ncbi:hypothetical protein GS597_06970 [Synechococcales cyanobacterium C]|uniref:Uncharacterized protein n=1 Tax=Petrachloros mirabilis ULC683 TaxID=2781853 RepID=A0A8K2A7S5_9CYAN|nr:hypothetical protein [Petrachloros mirabilis]NCJ06260.1 hypothetical protein [Petrachloros mirabilis ULC683]